MINVTTHLLALPESPAAQNNNVQARALAKTEVGREVLRRFAAEVAKLVETEDVRRCLARATAATSWQERFEAATDAQRELSMALWGERGAPVYEGGPQAQREAWTAQNEELELLARRLLDVARSAA